MVRFYARRCSLPPLLRSWASAYSWSTRPSLCGALLPLRFGVSRNSGTCDVDLASRWSMDQCTCGTPWRKPTNFLAVNCPELRRELLLLPGAGRCHSSLGCAHSVLRGKDEQGHWRTTTAKTYPSRLCRVLAAATHSAAQRLLPAAEPPVELDHDIAHFYQPLDAYAPDTWATVAPDFAGVLAPSVA